MHVSFVFFLNESRKRKSSFEAQGKEMIMTRKHPNWESTAEVAVSQS